MREIGGTPTSAEKFEPSGTENVAPGYEELTAEGVVVGVKGLSKWKVMVLGGVAEFLLFVQHLRVSTGVRSSAEISFKSLPEPIHRNCKNCKNVMS